MADRGKLRVALRRFWPWLILALTLIPAVWHVVDFPEDLDVEFPSGQRPTFSPFPPAYRLAEPGDTIDRIAIYTSSTGVVLSAIGLASHAAEHSGQRRWPSAWRRSGTRHPGPTFDGWHGLGWRAIFDPGAPVSARLALAAAAVDLRRSSPPRSGQSGTGSVSFWRGRNRAERSASGSPRRSSPCCGRSRSRASSRPATGRAGPWSGR